MNAIGKIIVLSAVMALSLAGCAAPLQVKERYFWPPPPETPRIEWKGTYQNQTNLKESAGGLMAAIIGEDHGLTLNYPLYIGADNAGKVYVSDQKAGTFLVFDFNTREVHPIGKGKAAGLFNNPSGVAVDGDGNVYAADLKLRKIFVFDREENHKGTLNVADKVESIGSIAVDKVRKRIIVPDLKGHKIAAFDFTGALVWSVGKRGIGGDEFNYPTSAAVDKDGNIIVCDSMNARIVRLTAEGKPLSFFGNRGDGTGDFSIIKAAAVDSEGHIYVTDGRSHKISVFNDKGEVLMVLGGYYQLEAGRVVPGGFNIPQGIFIDPKDAIYVVDQMNARFQVFQYVSEQYLKENPVTEAAPAAKPAAEPAPGGAKK